MDWYRRYHGTCADPKLRLVARTAKVPTPFAIAAWDACLEFASDRDDERGSIAGFSAELLAVTIDIETEDAERLLAAFRLRGMILADDTVKAWSKRQPNDPTAAERMRRYREKKRSGGESGGSEAGNSPKTATGDVTVTPIDRNERNATVTTLRPEKDSDSEIDKKDSIPLPLETPPPREDENGANAPAAALPGTIPSGSIFAEHCLIRAGANPAITFRAIDGWVALYGAAKTEVAVQKAMRRYRRDPVEYAEAVLTGRDQDGSAAVESAKLLATTPRRSALVEGLRKFDQTLAAMDDRDGEPASGARLPN